MHTYRSGQFRVERDPSRRCMKVREEVVLTLGLYCLPQLWQRWTYKKQRGSIGRCPSYKFTNCVKGKRVNVYIVKTKKYFWVRAIVVVTNSVMQKAYIKDIFEKHLKEFCND